MLKWIGNYSKATPDKGLILNPSLDLLQIDCYPDSKFAGIYGYEKDHDLECVKSRTEYIITVTNCPVI